MTETLPGTTSKELRFKISGMDCAEEVAVLKRELGPLVGGEEHLSFDILNGRMAVATDATPVAADDVIAAVGRTGMRATPWSTDEKVTDEGRLWQRFGRTSLTVLCGVFALFALAVHALYAGSVGAALGVTAAEAPLPLVAKLLYALSVLSGIWFFLPKAWFAILRLRPDMNLLMTVAVTGAMAIGEWAEAATVSFLFAISLALESWSVGRARRAIAALMTLAPPVTRIVLPDGGEEEVPPKSVPIGSTFVVGPGERIALDGQVTRGQSDVNQAAITGESVPVPKKPGDEVYAGTINGDGTLYATNTKAAEDTTLARIIRMVGDAQSKRAPSEQWVESFARVYTPAVMLLSLAVLLIPPLAFGGSWQVWLYNALVLLVIACPCALVISTPVSIVSAVAAAAREGVLVKGGVHIETPARLNALALDKTGTLTEGKPAVVEVVPLNGHTEQELLERAAAMEAHSDHPLAKAILRYADEKGFKFSRADSFQLVQGKGALASFDGRPFWLGSHRYLEERGQETPEIHAQLQSMSSAGRSVVVVGNDQHVCGLIALADTIRPNVKVVLEQLRSLGIEHVIMLTGDNQPTAEAIARQTGITEYRAELLPEDKVTAIEQLVETYGNVGMIGDGVNDAPALGRSTLGIAMGAVGSDAAIETADVALMSDDLSRLPWLVQHSRRTLAIIRQNIVASLGVKVLFVILTFMGFASLWTAIAADMGMSLLVILNGLRLLRSSR